MHGTPKKMIAASETPTITGYAGGKECGMYSSKLVDLPMAYPRNMVILQIRAFCLHTVGLIVDHEERQESITCSSGLISTPCELYVP